MATNLNDVLIDRYHQRVLDLYTRSFSGLVADPAYLDRMARDALDFGRAREQIALLENTPGLSITGKRVLEVGAGLGLTVALARLECGAESIGVEPGAEEYEGSLEIARDLLATCGLPPNLIVDGVGEQLPFDDATFDFAISSNVLEHVQDPAAVLRESIRVLRPGGILHFVVPNYGSWWEGHYGTLWLPNMPRWLAALYIRALGRDVGFLRTLQFVNRRMLADIIATFGDKVEVLGWGTDLWEHRVRSLDFSEYHSLDKLKRILRLLHKVGVVSLLIRVGKRLQWETPIILRLRKKAE